MIDSGRISLPDDSVKPPIYQVFIAEDPLDANDPQTLDEEENPTQERNRRYSKVKAPKNVENMPISSRRMKGRVSESCQKSADFLDRSQEEE